MSDWIRIAEEARIVAGEPYPAELDGAAIALYRYEGAIYAIGDNCTHEDVRLSEGWLDGDRIECPLHQSCFEIRTGKVIEGGPAWRDVPAYEVKVADGSVFVRAAG